MTTSQALPPALAEIVTDFQELEERDRLTLLLDFSRTLPALPERLTNHPELLEQVVECQSPLFLTVESEKTENGDVVRLYFKPHRKHRRPADLPRCFLKALTGLLRRKSSPFLTTCLSSWG